MILDSKKIEYELVDVAAGSEYLEEMRRIAGDPTAIPIQFSRGDQYLGVRRKLLFNYVHDNHNHSNNSINSYY